MISNDKSNTMVFSLIISVELNRERTNIDLEIPD